MGPQYKQNGLFVFLAECIAAVMRSFAFQAVALALLQCVFGIDPMESKSD